MTKHLPKIAGAALLLSSVVLLPGMIPLGWNAADGIESAGMTAATQAPIRKGDRLDIASRGPGCNGPSWSLYEGSCTRAADTLEVRRVRVIYVGPQSAATP
jgi:hypothetical protein